MNEHSMSVLTLWLAASGLNDNISYVIQLSYVAYRGRRPLSYQHFQSLVLRMFSLLSGIWVIVFVLMVFNLSSPSTLHARPNCSSMTTNSAHLRSCHAVGVLLRSDDGTQFTVPSQLLACRARRSSPGPQLSPSPSRHLSGTNSVSAMHRRRRQRGLDPCAGSCSACGRSCRNPNGRWGKANKARTCPHWDPPVSRSKQHSWLSEKRRASCSYERSSAMPVPIRVSF